MTAGRGFMQACQIHESEGTVVKTITGASLFAPDHAPVVGADRTCEAGFNQGPHAFAQVNDAIRMGALGEGLGAADEDVPQVDVVDAAGCRTKE